MADNPFDKFDPPPVAPAASPAANPFDQFDSPSGSETAADVAKSAASGAARSFLGAPGFVADYAKTTEALGRKGLQAVRDYIPEWIATPKQIDEALKEPLPAWTPQGLAERVLPTSEDLIKRSAKAAPGLEYQPKTGAGKAASFVGEVAGNPMSWLGPGSVAAKGLTNVGAGTGAYLADKLAPDDPLAQFAGGTLGALASSRIPNVVRFAGSPIRTLDPERIAAVDRLVARGIIPTAGQATDTGWLKVLEGTMGASVGSGKAAQQFEDRAQRAFNRELFRSAGHDADRATQPEINRAFNTLDNELNILKANNSIDWMQPNNQASFNRINNLVNHYERMTGVPGGIVNEAGENLQDVMTTTGQMTGSQYMSWRSQLSDMARNYIKAPATVTAGRALFNLVDILDTAMENSIQVNNPADLGRFVDARRRWGNLATITESLGSGKRANDFTPKGLVAALERRDDRGYARGRGDLAQLARDADLVLSEHLPEVYRNWLYAVHGGMGAIGAGLGFLSGGTTGAGLGALSAVGAGEPIIGRMLMSDRAQNYLRNQRYPQRPRSVTGDLPWAMIRGYDAMAPNQNDALGP